MLALDIDEGWGTRVGSGPRLTRTALTCVKARLEQVQVSDLLRSLRDDNARVTWHRLMFIIKGASLNVLQA
jgi:hypothetical protein